MILSSTWLLPLAVVPGTWEESAFAVQQELRSDVPVAGSTIPETPISGKGAPVVSEAVQASPPSVKYK